MYTDPKVEIKKVANGYIVNVKPEAPGEPPSALVDMIDKLLPVLNKLFTPAERQEDDDPIMSQIRKSQTEEASEPAEGSHIHIFKTWREVAEFLRVYFDK